MKPTMVLTALALLLTLVACGAGGDPEELTLDVEIRDRTIQGASTLQASQDDTLTLNITADEDAELHLHGYDLVWHLYGGETDTFTLVTHATGRFALELHVAALDDKHDHAHEGVEFTIGTLEVQPR